MPECINIKAYYDKSHFNVKDNNLHLSGINSINQYYIMKKNMGSTDKIIRIIIAAVIAVLYFTNVISGVFGIILLIFAAVFVLTSFISSCPLYSMLGISTVKKES